MPVMTDDRLLGLAALVLAPLVASFLAVVVDRLPRGEPVLAGRSRCRACGCWLGIADLVPVLSYMALGGRCRYCGAAIPRWLPGFELAALLLALQAVLATGDGAQAIVLAVAGVLLLAVAVIDARHFLIPDMLSLPLLLAGLVHAAATASGTFGSGAIGAAAGYLLLVGLAALYRQLKGREGLGRGDAKLLAAGGAWVGWQGLAAVLLLAALAGLATVLAAGLAGRRIGASEAVPFGPFLALGIWIVCLYPPLP